MISVRRVGLAPVDEQKTFSAVEKSGRLKLIASLEGKDGSVTVHADARVYAGTFAAGQRAELPIARGRGAWVQVARGAAKVNGEQLSAGDGLSLEHEASVSIEGVAGAEVLVFDLD